MNYILTTVGLSILTNYEPLRALGLYNYSNLDEKELDSDFLNKFESIYKELENEILQYSEQKIKRASAELNAILSFYNDKIKTQDIHQLLHTDTYLGKKSAQLIQIYLEKKMNMSVTLMTSSDLKTSNIEEFQMAISDLIVTLSEELTSYKSAGYKIIFNLTGGFKSINSFLQTIASLYADESIYIFETSSELLIVPKLPIQIDKTVVVENLDIFRKLSLGLSTDGKRLKSIPKSLIIQIDKEYTLSAWGELMWNEIKNEEYEKSFLASPYLKLKFSKEFEKKVESLQPNRLYELNKKIDDLVTYLKFKTNPKSLNFKILQGSPKVNSTHEFYINSDEAKRGYCHFDRKNNLVIDEYGKHL